ncbi:pseudaminic acid synthase [Sesbania bispinosa]|nr:pseudaminic acid synthase [Sesbania bispinosa]
MIQKHVTLKHTDGELISVLKIKEKYAEETMELAIDEHHAFKKPGDILYEFQQLQDTVKRASEAIP